MVSTMRKMRNGIHMTNCESTILQELKMKNVTRKSISKTIRLAMQSYEDEEGKIDWKKIKTACVEKWSLSGYEYILKLAWSRKCFDEAE
jgi:hypothetical protein